MNESKQDPSSPTEGTSRPFDARASFLALLRDAVAFGVEGFGSAERVVTAATDRAPASSPVPVAAPPEPPPVASPESLFTPAAVAAAPDDSLERVAEEARACRRCPLGGRRRNAVPGQGNPQAELMFVGEAPGADEDAKGLAFIGMAGQLLTKMIAAMGFAREEVFIANVLKCRPPDNREPQPEEVSQCLPFLERQIALVRPKVIVCLGSHAARNVLGTDSSVGRLRGRVHLAFGAQVVATYHPSYLMRMPSEKKKAWDDLQLALKLLGREPPQRPAPSTE